MPKTPDDMSASAIKRREELSADAKVVKPEVVAPPKPRIAKKR